MVDCFYNMWMGYTCRDVFHWLEGRGLIEHAVLSGLGVCGLHVICLALHSRILFVLCAVSENKRPVLQC